MAKRKVLARPAASHPTKQSVNQLFQGAKSESIRKQLTVGILGRRMRTDDIIDIQMPPVILEYNPLVSLECSDILQFVGKEEISATCITVYIQ